MRADPHLQTTPTIITTAMADPKLSVKGFKAGATLAMHKPLETQRGLTWDCWGNSHPPRR